ncbi:SprT family zinc-dependent metalloprotease [Sinorhizobium sp. BG8]|uniref:M48 family metallopeptidase n=1 Tax=Sinorhizobium sp. BG8 TaxID=2613773 RepID=UPI00193CC7FF|nr:SprT family zinc-dependent metalloprotease [Sinorhizobium sp. BG8]QRM53662.1 M48 family metallopeptidase [Sinorhizobium sp. BG8]
MFPSLRKPRRTLRTPPPPETRQLEVNGRTLPLTIRRNARATRLTLRIEPGGRALRMTIPTGLPERDIRDFLDRHQAWLMTKLARFSSSNALCDGAHVFVRGVAHRIEATGRLRGLTEAVVENGEAILRVSGLEEHLPRRISDFLKKEARRDLDERVSIHALSVGKKVKSLTLRDTRSRWGSCSADGALSFSWRIAMAPPHVIDYLAAHEVAHLREMNHSPKFWALCAKLCPQMEDAKRWLKRNGTMLHALDFD